MSDTTDDEFQERDGMLQVARIFNSPEGNEGVCRCLEDSVRIQGIGDQERPLWLTILKPGLLDTLTFIEDDRMKVPLGESEKSRSMSKQPVSSKSNLPRLAERIR